MSAPLPHGQPAWVRKRDSSLAPFEADKICRALFAATESLGRPDAFLARELTDGVVHFLADEGHTSIPTTAELAELIVKTVRELGQPQLARTFEEWRQSREEMATTTQLAESPGPSPPLKRPSSPARACEVEVRFSVETPLPEVLAECTRRYTLQAVFARDVVSIHNDGLLVLTGLDTPGELASCVLPGLVPSEGEGGLVEALRQLRRHTGQVAVLDGPEHHLARASQTDSDSAARLVSDLEQGLHLTGLGVVVNLNSALPPSAVDDLAGGPLFAGQRRTPDPQQLSTLADELLDRLVQLPLAPEQLRVDWHLSERDFTPDKRSQERLHRLARRLLESAGVACVFDRPRRPLALAEGINRQHPAVLLQVGLHLPRLAEQTGTLTDTGRFLQKLGSLARLALSAGVQKRAYLRRREGPGALPALTRGFLLDRGRLVVTPVGLDSMVRTFTGRSLCAGGAALDLGRQIVLRLREVLRQDGRTSRLETCLDGPVSFALAGASEAAAGLTGWEPTAGVKNQWRAAGVLHAVAEQGSLALFLPEKQCLGGEAMVECLQTIWQQTEVVRLRLSPTLPTSRQQSLALLTDASEKR